jgi:hypothetical protein
MAVTQLNKITMHVRRKYENRPWHLWPSIEAIANNQLFGNDKLEMLLERLTGPYYF